MKKYFIIIFLLIIIWQGCSERDFIMTESDTTITDTFSDSGLIKAGIEFSIEKDTPKIEIFNRDSERLLFSINYKAGGGFFIQKDRTTREFLNRIESITVKENSSEIMLLSENGRRGTLYVSNNADNLTINFKPDKKSSTEQVGVILNTTEREGYYGLMERVVQGDQDKSWEEGMKEGLNLRGQEVLLYTYPTLSVYSPFFVSTNGYGIFTESNWPGKYLFGTEKGDQIG
ncbi:MAG: hypothetical protein N3B13_10080, partial [Deltaproteobacteria bacterium]|nr:hypothetical protein [Deltaproteobacteria bacterium]